MEMTELRMIGISGISMDGATSSRGCPCQYMLQVYKLWLWVVLNNKAIWLDTSINILITWQGVKIARNCTAVARKEIMLPGNQTMLVPVKVADVH